MRSPFVGLIAAVHTPFHADGSLNLNAVEQQAELLVESGVHGVFVAGTTGEAHSLTVEERRLLNRRWTEVARGTSLTVAIHVGHHCQQDACVLASQAAEIGADAVAAMAPSYFKPATVQDLVEFLVPIAGHAPDLPFYYYDIPLMTGVSLPMASFLRQAKQRIPTLRGLKYSNRDLMQFQECVQLEGGAFEVFYGQDETLLAGLVLGARGAVGSTYNFATPVYHRLLQALAAHDLEMARREQLTSVKLVGTLMGFGFPAAAKAVMAMLGVDCGPVRPPLRNLTREERALLYEQLLPLEVFPRPLRRP